jgi:hypothetical protein
MSKYILIISALFVLSGKLYTQNCDCIEKSKTENAFYNLSYNINGFYMTPEDIIRSYLDLKCEQPIGLNKKATAVTCFGNWTFFMAKDPSTNVWFVNSSELRTFTNCDIALKASLNFLAAPAGVDVWFSNDVVIRMEVIEWPMYKFSFQKKQ